MKLSKNFKLEEFEYSKTAVELDVPNSATPIIIKNLKALCVNLLQPLRTELAIPIFISSGYRCLAVNQMVGGSETSKHMSGQAADIYSTRTTPYKLAQAIIDMGLEFDQIILYPTFVHVSYIIPTQTKQNRKQVLYNSSYTGKKLKGTKKLS